MTFGTKLDSGDNDYEYLANRHGHGNGVLIQKQSLVRHVAAQPTLVNGVYHSTFKLAAVTDEQSLRKLDSLKKRSRDPVINLRRPKRIAARSNSSKYCCLLKVRIQNVACPKSFTSPC